MTQRHQVDVLTDWYPPHFRGGGPTKTLAAIVANEAPHHDIRVITRDRDLGATAPTSYVMNNSSAEVINIPPASFLRASTTLCARTSELIYLNSIYSPTFTISPYLSTLLRQTKPHTVAIAPRGELFPDAINIRSWKKLPWIQFVRTTLSAIPAHVVWHASSSDEREAIVSVFGGKHPIVIQRDPPPPVAPTLHAPEHGPLRLVFVARMVPIKNFMFCLRALRHTTRPIEVTAIGALEDSAYWQECRRLIGRLPSHVKIISTGHVTPTEMEMRLRGADALILPTLSENFGHAIAEALAHGIPCLIPDTTLWTPLITQGAGQLIDLDSPESFGEFLSTPSTTTWLRSITTRRRTQEIYREWLTTNAQDGSLFDELLNASSADS